MSRDEVHLLFHLLKYKGITKVSPGDIKENIIKSRKIRAMKYQ